MSYWNPWRGCHKVSEGCLHCYIHKGDAKRGKDTSIITKSRNFDAPIKMKNNQYSMKPNQICYTCFSSDFFLEEADEYRDECWQMMKVRKDINFLFLTKRIERFYDCIPDDWEDGYENVIIGCTAENQKNVDKKISYFHSLPIKHKIIILQPLLESVDISLYLENIEEVVVGGESDLNARPFHFEWVLDIRKQCIKKNVPFTLRQLGTHFIKDNKEYYIKTKDLMSLAKRARVNTKKVDN